MQLKENESDFDTKTKEELLATLFQLVAEPQTAAAIEGTAWEIQPKPKSSTAKHPLLKSNGSNGDSPSADRQWE